MDFRLFFKNKFLRKTFGEFANSLDNSDYSKFKQTLKDNRSWYIPASLFNTQDKTIKKLFDTIDGSGLGKDSSGNLINNHSGSKNQRLEIQEMYDWIKYNYKLYKGSEISDEELSKMKMSEFMNYVEDFLNQGFEL